MQEGYLSPANTSRIHGVKKNALGLRSSVHHQATELEDIQIVKELGRNVITGSGIAWSICVDVITLLGHGPIRPRTMVHKLTAFVISPSFVSASHNPGCGLLRSEEMSWVRVRQWLSWCETFTGEVQRRPV